MTGEEATLTVAGNEVVPGDTATVLTMVVPAGTLSTVGAEAGGIFCVAAAAAASAAIPLIWGLLPITWGEERLRGPPHVPPLASHNPNSPTLAQLLQYPCISNCPPNPDASPWVPYQASPT